MNPRHLFAVAALFGAAALHAQDAEAAQQKIVELLQAELPTAGFLAAVDSAVAEGQLTAPQGVEAALIYGITRRPADGLGEIADRAAAAANYKAEGAVLLKSPEMLASARQALLGAEAYAKGDLAGFERHLKEAWWLSPELSQFFGGWVEEHRQAEAMKSLRLPLDLTIARSAGGETTLGGLLQGQKAVLLDFWAGWCSPCMQLMPELAKKAEKLGPQKIRVAGMNTEDQADAEKVRLQRQIAFDWLVEPSDRPYSQLLGIDSIPRMILVGPEGEVLFNGHPMDDALTTALAKVGATL